MKTKTKKKIIFIGISAIVFVFLLYWYIVFNIKRNLIPFFDDTLTGTWIEQLDAGEESLEYAVAMGKYSDIKKKLKEGEDINRKDQNLGVTPLMIAASIMDEEESLKMCRFLIKNGADMNQRMKTEEMEYSVTLPYYCIQECFDEVDNSIIEIFIENGYDVHEEMEWTYMILRKKSVNKKQIKTTKRR